MAVGMRMGRAPVPVKVVFVLMVFVVRVTVGVFHRLMRMGSGIGTAWSSLPPRWIASIITRCILGLLHRNRRASTEGHASCG